MGDHLLLGILALSPAIVEKLLPNYLVTSPAWLNFPSTQNVYDLSPGYYDIKFTITLETKDKTKKLLEHHGLKKSYLHCMSFLVPPPAAGTEDVATVPVSGTGNNISFEEKKTILIQKQGTGIFVQTDKPVYNPGQQVHFRIVTLNSHFVPVNDKYSMLELQDPNSNRIAQWLEVVPKQGIVELSFQLAPEVTLGTYTVAVTEGKTFGTFSVEEYVLPKFKVEVVEPTQLSMIEESFLVKICCRYTYGKPMLGAVHVSVCQRAHTYWFEAKQEQLSDKCSNLSGQVSKWDLEKEPDHFSASVNMSTFNLTSHMYSESINIVATVVEEGTGVEANDTPNIYISSQIGSMSFEDISDYYYPNFPFSEKIRVRGHDGSLLKNHAVFLKIYGINATINHTLLTDNDRLASFKLDMVNWNGTDRALFFLFLSQGRFQMEEVAYNLEQVPKYYENAHLHLQPFYNTTLSFLRIHQRNDILCGQPQELPVEYYIDPADASPDEYITFSYYLIGKGSLEMEGQKHLSSKMKGRKGSFSLTLTFNFRLAPGPSLIVYAIFPSGRVIADKILEMCFDNQVSLGFSLSQQLLGAGVDLQLQAAPGSLCAVRTVDESVLLLRPERELSNHSVSSMFSFWHRHYHEVDEYEECPVSSPRDLPQRHIVPVSEERWSKHSVTWRRPWFSQDDLLCFFKNMGLKILSNAKIKKPVDCSQQSPKYTIISGGSYLLSDHFTSVALGSPSPSIGSEDSQVRQYFPETWLWDLFPIGNLGKETVHVTIPDTVTKWKAMTFCTSQSSGFGLSPTVELTAFKPFFVELTLPYSAVCGESFRFTATIFNYLKDCITVQTHLAKSEEYVESWTDSQSSSCLCADEAKTYHWNITAIKLGRVNFTISTKILDSNELFKGQKRFIPEKDWSDTVIKPVLVKPEGVLVEKTHSSLLCPKRNVAAEFISLELPVDVVPDSIKAYVTVLDIMGTALENLNSLVQMPSGCGENMVLFAPLICVLQLGKSGPLTKETRSRGGFLEIGYQKELTYKHSNGSYNAFGEQDGNGNTWLTAFITRCFSQAQEFISIDDKNIQDALKWMAGNQLPSGCYANVGKLIHTAMKGDVDDEISLTAYIPAAMLEMKMAIDDPMVSQGLRCLKNSVSSTTNLYTQALLAYTFSLAGEMDVRNILLVQLDQQAIISGESIHWSQKPTQSSDTSSSKLEAIDVELTAYVLLACLSKVNLTQNEMAKTTGILTWLAKESNAYGGFSSTQDTVVALQALDKFATTAFVPSEEVNLAVKSAENFQHTFYVQAANRLVFQQEILPNAPGIAPGMYSSEATGQGCVYMVLRYNILPPKDVETFSLSVEMGKSRCDEPTSSSLILTSHSSFASFCPQLCGSRSSSNMAIVKVKMLSGFSPVEGTNQQSFGNSARRIGKGVALSLLSFSFHIQLLQQPLLKKVESGPDVINIYLEEEPGYHPEDARVPHSAIAVERPALAQFRPSNRRAEIGEKEGKKREKAREGGKPRGLECGGPGAASSWQRAPAGNEGLAEGGGGWRRGEGRAGGGVRLPRKHLPASPLLQPARSPRPAAPTFSAPQEVTGPERAPEAWRSRGRARTRSGGRGGEPRPRRAPPIPPSAPPPLQEGEEARGARRGGRASPPPSPETGVPGT
ncbi:LOW QUALITY PROTEIN: alpha-2-macroglobulin-like protein 1 [Rhynchonycteris naso]